MGAVNEQGKGFIFRTVFLCKSPKPAQSFSVYGLSAHRNERVQSQRTAYHHLKREIHPLITPLLRAGGRQTYALSFLPCESLLH